MNGQSARRGFTLVELVVVTAIILVLVGLISAAVRVALIRGAEVRNRNDIMQLDMALQGFKTQYGFYPPSQLKLCEQAQYGSSLLDSDSQYYLQTMFPRIVFPPVSTAAGAPYLDWSGNNALNTIPAVLTGDQCLVFFLGGIQGIYGFNTNPATPTFNINLPPPPGTSATPIFYEFQVNRRFLGSNGYYSYLDVYKQQPILYFSAYKNANGYTRYGTPDPDCSTQIANGPYLQSAGVFWKPSSFQIISAGRNGTFCQGGKIYTPGNATLNVNNGLVDGITPSDDQANFATSLLGGGN